MGVLSGLRKKHDDVKKQVMKREIELREMKVSSSHTEITRSVGGIRLTYREQSLPNALKNRTFGTIVRTQLNDA